VLARGARLTFVAPSAEQASDLTDLILNQLRARGLNLTVRGKPIKVPKH
jgi:hypothetical protein